MKGSFVLGSIFGIKIEINISWLVAFFLITTTLATGFFPGRYPDWEAELYWILGGTIALLLLLSIVFHEMSHSIVANRLGIGVRRITLFIFGGIADLEREPDTPKKEFFISVAGPIMSLFLVVVFRSLAYVSNSIGAPEYYSVVFSYISSINLMLAIFNMFPAFPLDGGRVLRSAIWHFSGDLHKATRIASTIGQWFGYFLMFIGLTNIFYGFMINGLWILFIGYFMVQASQSSYQNTIVSDIFSKTIVGEFMTGDVVVMDPEITVRRGVEDYFFKYKYNLFPVGSLDRIDGVVNVDNIKKVHRDDWETVRIEDVMTSLSQNLVVAPDETVSRVMSKIFSNEFGRVLVMNEDRLVGIVSRTDIMNHLRIYMQLNKVK